jgi:hypothetical protein
MKIENLILFWQLSIYESDHLLKYDYRHYLLIQKLAPSRQGCFCNSKSIEFLLFYVG